MSTKSTAPADPRSLIAGHVSPQRGRWLVVITAALWSTSGFFAQSPVFADWPLAERGILLAFWRALFASLVLIPLIRRPSWSWKMPLMIGAFVLMNITFLTAMVNTSSANAIWLQNTAPLWVFLVGVFLLGEVGRRADAWLIVFCGLGVGFILWYEIGGAAPWGVFCGLFSGATYATVVLCMRLLRGHDAAWLAVMNLGGTVVVLFPLVLVSGVMPQGGQWFYLTAFGVLQMGLPYLLFGLGLRAITGHEAAGIGLLEPILVPIWVWIAYRDLPAWWTIVGGTLIMLGLLLRYWAAARRPRVAPVATLTEEAAIVPGSSE